MHDQNRHGFTLAEVAIAGFLVALLSACVFRGIIIVQQNSQATAQRIAAQGVCMHRYEEMKAVAFENIDENLFPATNVLLASLSKDPSQGLIMADLANTITTSDDAPLRKMVDITCSWTFRGRTRTETLHGVIVDGYSTYAECGSLSGTLELNPNLERPLIFYAKGTDGSVYTQSTLSKVPSSFTATTLVIKPGGSDRQNVNIQGDDRAISNDKVVSYIAGGLDKPISCTFSTSESSEGRTLYSLSFSCDMAAFSYK